MKLKYLSLVISTGLLATTASAASFTLYGNVDAAARGYFSKSKGILSDKAAAIMNVPSGAETAKLGNVPLLEALEKGLGFKLVNGQLVGKTSANAQTTMVKTRRVGLHDGYLKGSYVGLKGNENLMGNTSIGFILEGGFNIGQGALNHPGQLFDRAALLYVDGVFGRVALGMQPDLLNGLGMNNLYAHTVNPVVNYLGSANTVNGAVLDKAVTYHSPTIAGLDLALLFSPDATNNSGNKFKDNNRVAQAALRFVAGPVEVTAVGSRTFFGSANNTVQGDKDGYQIGQFVWSMAHPKQARVVMPLSNQPAMQLPRPTSSVVSLGANVAFGPVKVFGMGQKVWHDVNGLSGWGASLGTSTSFGQTGVLLNVGYQHLKGDFTDVRLGNPSVPEHNNLWSKRVDVNLVLNYQLSKRVSLYAGSSLTQVKESISNETSINKGNAIAVSGFSFQPKASYTLYRTYKTTNITGFAGLSVGF